ncbi:MAG: formylglycine-generating enzyme family protein [Chloroflexi bacterium]|nr:formylglycine-generating enzyme family protein [Chloroflexota bacterium]
MKKSSGPLNGVLLLALILTSCGLPGYSTQLPPSSPPAVVETSPPVPDTVAKEALQVVNIDLQKPVVGTTMQWMDGSILVYVPEGSFQMGADQIDNPEHTVNLSSYWIYQTKVTNRMYGLCVKLGICSLPLTSQAQADLENHYLLDRPVVDVDWEQAQNYCTWVHGQLPTEAQWEKSARGPDGNVYPWGQADPVCDLLNFNKCLGKTSRVFDYINGKSYYSAYDLAGNTFEWVNDWYDPDYYPNGPDDNPPGPQTGTRRAVRGSSFLSNKDQIPVSLRSFSAPDQYRPDLGFRCVVEQPHVFAPYCVSNNFVPGDANVPPPSRSCDVSEHEVGRSCGLVNHDIEGAGELRGVTGRPPLTGCVIAGAPNRISCSGPASTTGLVTVAVVCGTINPGDRPADPTCMEGYVPAPGSETSCAIVPGSSPSGPGGCPAGMVPSPGPGGLTFCVGRTSGGEGELEVVEEIGTAVPTDPAEAEARALGCLPGMTAETAPDGSTICTATAPDGRSVLCPAHTIPMLTTDGSFVCVGRGAPGEPCPPGTYSTPFAGGSVCMGPAGETLPDGELTNPCLEGFTFDSALGCCQSPGGAYPGCAEGEYYDTVHGCQPRPEASGAIVTALSFNATTGSCGGDLPGGGPDGGPDCGAIESSATCDTTPGCHFDYDPGVKACVPD